MSSRITRAVAATLIAGSALFATSGCSLLYPHPGATTFPTDDPSSTPDPKPTKTTKPKPTATASPTPTEQPKKKAVVQIDDAFVDTDNNLVSVIAQVTNIFEDGGKCILLVTSGNTTKSVTVRAESNVNSTQCSPMDLDTAGLKSGDATATVSYVSDGYKGTSDAWDIVIP